MTPVELAMINPAQKSPFVEPVITLSVPGISCAGCVGKIEKAFACAPEALSCVVNLAEKTCHITGTAPPERMVEVIASVGFKATVVESEQLNRVRQEARDRDDFRRRLLYAFIALGVSVPLMVWGMVFDTMMVIPGHNQWQWGVAGLATLAVLVVCGGHFFRGLWLSLKNRSATMDTLVAMGTGAAWLYSVCVVLFPESLPVSARHVYFEASAMIIGLINAGQAIELRARGKTGEAIRGLLKLQVPVARLVTADGEREVPIEQVRPGDRLRLVPGDRVPVDGEVLEGKTLVDESMLTGEPLAVAKTRGEQVSAGTINGNGSVLILARRVGSDTALARIIALVKQAQNSKLPIARLADRVASVFVPMVITVALLAAAVWLALGPEPALTHALVVAVTVLIIACPCALGLATPMSVMVGVGKAAELGMLVRRGEALQTASRLTTVVLDKTGTLTEGRPVVTDVHARKGFTHQRLLTLAAALEQRSEHPLAAAVVEAAAAETGRLPVLEAFSAETGRGLRGQVQGQSLLLGNERLMQDCRIPLEPVREQAAALAEAGRTVIYLAVDNQLAGLLAVADPVRQDSADAVNRLQQLGLKVIMMTGDHPATAAAVARDTGIDSFYAQVLPEDKERYVRKLQAAGAVVAMSGDGINDAPALARADVGLALGTGADVAIEAADITLMRPSLHGVADAIELSRATLKNIRQNLVGAFIYNTLGIPVAAGVLYPLTGLLLNPVLAGAAMALSSVTVVTNANRLRRFQPTQRSPLH